MKHTLGFLSTFIGSMVVSTSFETIDNPFWYVTGIVIDDVVSYNAGSLNK